MPEHVHLLVYPRREVYSISAVLKSLKLPVTNNAINWLRDHEPAFLEELCDRQPNGDVAYRFWQRGGGHDVNLWDPGRIWDKIDYMHANPVHRGLCEQPNDWKWSSARDFAGLGPGAIPLNHEHLPADLRQLRRRGRSR
jgi:putative transposase